jgi:endonuclease/exonuclease/phosphatase family metal-dependent hydrolase
MKGRRLLGLTLALGLSVALAGATEVRILSWNIKRAVGVNDPNDARQPYVAKIMNHLRPDILILQEVGGNTRTSWNAFAQENALDTFVRNNLTFFGANPQRNRDYFIYVNRLSDGWISNAVISRYPIRTITDVGIGSPNRGLTIGLIDVPGTNGLGVFGAHFAAGGTSADAVQRQTHAENTRNRIRDWRIRNRRSAYVLGGDLNENEDPDLSSTFPIGGTLPDGRVYAPISTVQSARLRILCLWMGWAASAPIRSPAATPTCAVGWTTSWSPPRNWGATVSVCWRRRYSTRAGSRQARCPQALSSPTARTPRITPRCLCAFALTSGVPTATAAEATGFPNRVRCSRCWFSQAGARRLCCGAGARRSVQSNSYDR